MNRIIRIVGVVWLAAGLVGCSPQAKKANHLARANKYYTAGDLSSAEIEFMNALRIEQNNPEAIRKLGLIYYAQGEMPKAFAYLSKAKDLNKEDVEARAKLAIFYASMRNQAKEAQAEVDFVLSKDPAHEEVVLLITDMVNSITNLPAAHQRIQALKQQAGDKAIYHVAIGSLLLKTNNLKGAETEFSQAVKLDPNSGVAHLSMGNVLWAQGQTNEASAAFAKAYELSPPHSQRRLRVVDFKLRMGQVEEARKLLDGVTKSAPDFLPAGIYKARLAFAEKKYEDTSKQLESVLARDGTNIEALLLKAQLQVAQGQFAKAVTELDRLASQVPRMPQVHYQLGMAHLLNRDMNRAVASLQQAVALEPNFLEAIMALAQINMRRGEAASAIVTLQEQIAKRPRLLNLHYTLAEAYRVAGRLDDAANTYRRLTEVTPTNARPAMMLGSVLRQQRKPVEARKQFERVLELSPDNPDAIEQLVELDMAATNFVAATARLQSQIQKYPKEPGPLYFLAQVQMAERKPQEAEATLLKVLELTPDNRQAQFALAQVYLLTKRTDEAIKRYEGAIAKDPKDVGARFQIGMIYSAQNEHAKARAVYEEILKISPDHAGALNNLAYLLSEHLGDLDRALELATRLRKLSPNDPYSPDTLGWIQLRRGDYAVALDLITESAQRMPNNPEVLYHLGMAHYMMGEEQPALSALERALVSNRDFPGKADAQRALTVLKIPAQTVDPRYLSDLENASKQRPDDPVVLARLAALYQKQGARDKVLELYSRAIERNPRSVPALMKLTELNLERPGGTNDALRFARAARQADPENAHVAALLGRTSLRVGDTKTALTLLQEANAKLPRDPDVSYDFALVTYHFGRVREATTMVQNALQSAGTNAFARRDAATRFLAMISLDTPDKALAASARVQEALAAEPNSVPALMAAALVYEKQNRGAAAQEAYRKILTINPAFAPAMKGLAGLLAFEPGKEKEAYDLATRAREVFTDDADLERTLGVLAYGRGEFPRAVQLLKLSRQKKSADVEVMYALGLAQVKSNDKEGVETLKKALAASPNHRLAGEAKAAVASGTPR